MSVELSEAAWPWLTPEDAVLQGRDPAIPGLDRVLCPQRALACLADRFPAGALLPRHPVVRSLRYRPGASLTAAVEVEGPPRMRRTALLAASAALVAGVLA
ncbi:MAG: hypothetical protein HOQ22_07755, partial [Nocardioidaceae bacterium]|nr:hypothetical protein [Nocardioidaceae bacterium]